MSEVVLISRNHIDKESDDKMQETEVKQDVNFSDIHPIGLTDKSSDTKTTSSGDNYSNNSKEICLDNGEITATQARSNSFLNLECSHNLNLNSDINHEIVGKDNTAKSLRDQSNLCKSDEVISNIVHLPSKGGTGRSSDDNLFKNPKLNCDTFAERSDNECVRRNSLPGRCVDEIFIQEKNLSSMSIDCMKDQSIPENKSYHGIPTLQSERTKIAPDMKNLSDVVKNVHGLFSIVGGSLKNAYKPMEKNFGEMMIATQKNISSAKNGYLLKNDKSNTQINSNNPVDSISKYTTLNLSNESNDDINLFSKCDNFSNQPKKKVTGYKKTNDNSDNFEFGTTSLTTCQSIMDSVNEKNTSECKVKSSPHFENNFDVNLVNNGDSKYAKIEERDVLIKNETVSNNVANNEVNSYSVECLSQEEIKRLACLETVVLEQSQQLEIMKLTIFEKDTACKDLEEKINTLSGKLELTTKERNASVMRYAVSERAALEAAKARDSALATEAMARNEAALLAQRLRAAHADRGRVCDMFDEKCHEVTASQKEVSRLKEEMQSCEVKLKWAQSKLVTEMESHKESAALAEKLNLQLSKMEGNYAAAVQQTPDAEVQMKEKEATIILERHERDRAEARCKLLHSEVDQLKKALTSCGDEVRELRAQVESGTAESAALRDCCAELRAQGARDCEKLAAAQARAARVDTLSVHLQQEQEANAKLQKALESEKLSLEEALAEVELRSRREAELLRQAERLTEAGVRLQATCSEAESKALALHVDNASLRSSAASAAMSSAEHSARALAEREGRASDARSLAAAAARSARNEKTARAALEAAQGEARAKEAKHASAIKELKREAQQWKRKYERLETDGHSQPSISANSQRTGSCSSLSSFEGTLQQNHQGENSDAILPNVQCVTKAPEIQQMVERIVTLQRQSARKNERLDFLEEHSSQLTRELQRKSRLLRELLSNMPGGALAPPSSDRAKAEIGKRGGIMSSVYGSHVNDDTMTIELSLEINAKLQNVLEDALLKNITLKENMDTLGDEIARLKEQLQKGNKN